MSLPPDAETGPLQAWLAITEDAAAPDTPLPDDRRGVSRRLLALTAGTCLAALALGIAAHSAPRGTAAPAPAATLAVEGGVATESGGMTATGSEDPAAVAAAITAVRLHGPPDVYVDTAVVDAVTDEGSTTIVSVRAVVLPRTDKGWGAPQPARYAVAIRTSSGLPDVLAGPWPLPDLAAPPAAAPGWEPAPDLRTAATAALSSAGYRHPTALAVRRSTDLDGIVSVVCTALAPGESTARRHDVWLTSDAGHVLGAPSPTAELPLPLEQP